MYLPAIEVDTHQADHHVSARSSCEPNILLSVLPNALLTDSSLKLHLSMPYQSTVILQPFGFFDGIKEFHPHSKDSSLFVIDVPKLTRWIPALLMR